MSQQHCIIANIILQDNDVAQILKFLKKIGVTLFLSLLARGLRKQATGCSSGSDYANYVGRSSVNFPSQFRCFAGAYIV